MNLLSDSLQSCIIPESLTKQTILTLPFGARTVAAVKCYWKLCLDFPVEKRLTNFTITLCGLKVFHYNRNCLVPLW